MRRERSKAGKIFASAPPPPKRLKCDKNSSISMKIDFFQFRRCPRVGKFFLPRASDGKKECQIRV